MNKDEEENNHVDWQSVNKDQAAGLPDGLLHEDGSPMESYSFPQEFCKQWRVIVLSTVLLGILLGVLLVVAVVTMGLVAHLAEWLLYSKS